MTKERLEKLLAHFTPLIIHSGTAFPGLVSELTLDMAVYEAVVAAHVSVALAQDRRRDPPLHTGWRLVEGDPRNSSIENGAVIWVIHGEEGGNDAFLRSMYLLQFDAHWELKYPDVNARIIQSLIDVAK